MASTPTNAFPLNRRQFIGTSAGAALVLPFGEQTSAAVGPENGSHRQATGVRVGEVTDRSAIIWTRLTAHSTRNNDGVKIEGIYDKKQPKAVTVAASEIEGACPGSAGRVSIRYGKRQDLSDARSTDWADVSEKEDFTHQFRLEGLEPGSRYFYVSETTGPGGAPQHVPVAGQFETAPSANSPSELTFCAMTCQSYTDRDHPGGHAIYGSMLALRPQFVCLTGDLVYYDTEEPRAVNPVLARLHWARMFSQPLQWELLRHAATYWLKDDHDTLDDDTWPGKSLGSLSYAEGQRIFREQAPMSGLGYRTFRWGRDLQVWFTDGRDYRSSNTMPDGPEKTIWGPEQKHWFKETIQESKATWKVLVSPTPLVGPDRPTKNDNHSNRGFAHEGNEIRTWLKQHVPENFFVVCGDRHWQYHSVDPTTQVQEFSVGPASDKHAGGTPGEDKTYHRFHRVKGGFLSVSLARDGETSVITFAHRDVQGVVVYSASFRRPASSV